jgi:thioredoxin-related protein
MSLYAQNEGIRFLNDSTLQSALIKAKKENKLLFIDCYTSWCRPCKYMASTIFTKPEVGSFYNQHFLNWKIDCEKIKKNDSLAFAKLKIKAFPTFLFFDGNGNIVHQAVGAGSEKQFIELGETALDSTKNYAAIKNKIIHGDRSNTTLMMFYGCDVDASDKYIDEHFALVDDSVKFSKVSWELFNYCVKNIDGESFKFFKANLGKYEATFGKEQVDEKFMRLFRYYSNPGKEKQLENIASIDSMRYMRFCKMQEFEKLYHQYSVLKNNKENWNKLIEYTLALFAKGYLDVPTLNDISWLIYENYKSFKDLNALKQAQQWSKKTVDTKPENHAFNDTYAHIIFDLGNKAEAIQREEFALKKATEENAAEQIKFYSEEIKRFKGSK